MKEHVFEKLCRKLERNLKHIRYEEKRMSNIAFIASSATLNEIEELISEWAQVNNINLIAVTKDELSQFSGCYFDDLRSQKTHPHNLEQLITKPRTVLFIKDAHLLPDTNDRRKLINLVCHHALDGFRTIYGKKYENGSKYLDNLLFAIMTYDDTNKDYSEKLGLFTHDAKDTFTECHLDNINK